MTRIWNSYANAMLLTNVAYDDNHCGCAILGGHRVVPVFSQPLAVCPTGSEPRRDL